MYVKNQLKSRIRILIRKMYVKNQLKSRIRILIRKKSYRIDNTDLNCNGKISESLRIRQQERCLAARGKLYPYIHCLSLLNWIYVNLEDKSRKL